MRNNLIISTAALAALVLAGCKGQTTTDKAKPDAADKAQVEATASAELCTDMGPQTPRDITFKAGKNMTKFPMAPNYRKLNLCNIHTHTNAEHKGPGFSTFVNNSDNGGYACNDTDTLTDAQLIDPMGGKGAYKGVKPGDTIEVHWVHTSCDITPGPTLGSCLSDTCSDPLLRVETQVFLVVNDPDNAYDFTKLAYGGTQRNGFHQAIKIPNDTGKPVVFRGSTTGPKYTQSVCSPMKVTWSVRPQCARVDISSLHKWASEGNVFNETKSHGVRQLVTAPELISPIR